jgi:hypothetical protein
MKYLVIPEVTAADSMLGGLSLAGPSMAIHGRLEAYSCESVLHWWHGTKCALVTGKRTGEDKKIASLLHQQMVNGDAPLDRRCHHLSMYRAHSCQT